jgi:hypothetical protein
VKGGREGYTPWTWFMSAGLMGVARARMRRELEGSEGEMEWVWRLRVCQLLRFEDRWSMGEAYKRTSDGSPYFE